MTEISATIRESTGQYRATLQRTNASSPNPLGIHLTRQGRCDKQQVCSHIIVSNAWCTQLRVTCLNCVQGKSLPLSLCPPTGIAQSHSSLNPRGSWGREREPLCVRVGGRWALIGPAQSAPSPDRPGGGEIRMACREEVLKA